jgi:hypothetical protein
MVLVARTWQCAPDGAVPAARTQSSTTPAAMLANNGRYQLRTVLFQRRAHSPLPLRQQCWQTNQGSRYQLGLADLSVLRNLTDLRVVKNSKNWRALCTWTSVVSRHMWVAIVRQATNLRTLRPGQPLLLKPDMPSLRLFSFLPANERYTGWPRSFAPHEQLGRRRAQQRSHKQIAVQPISHGQTKIWNHQVEVGPSEIVDKGNWPLLVISRLQSRIRAGLLLVI